MFRLRSLLPLLIFGVLLYIPLGGWKTLSGSVGLSLGSNEVRTYGAAHDVPGFHWVTVLNSDGVDNGPVHLGFFDSCLIRYRGEVHEITSHFSLWAWWSEDTLLEYVNPEGQPSRGVLCPDGTVFMMEPDTVQDFNARFAERHAYETELRDMVRTAAREQGGQRYGVYENLQWVEVLNPQGVETFGYEVDFLGTCIMERGGVVEEVGRIDYGTLARYEPDPALGFRGVGIPCPADTLFVLEGDRLAYE